MRRQLPISPKVPVPRARAAHFTASSGALPPLRVRSSTDKRVVRSEKYGDEERAVYEYIAESSNGSITSVRLDCGSGVCKSKRVIAVISLR
jgi:hypothetical protein